MVYFFSYPQFFDWLEHRWATSYARYLCVDKGGKPTFERVMAGLALLKKHHVEFNILTTLHVANIEHPLEVYRFLRDEVGTQFMQFIPIVERDNATGFQEGEQINHSISLRYGY